MSVKKIIFCLPGREYSGDFLCSWTKLIQHCMSLGHQMYFSQRYTSNVYYVRSLCLGADVRRGTHQHPFDGKIDYDFIMWIDSDIIFTTDQFEKLISNDLDICGGVYLMDGGKQFAVVKDWNEQKFKENGTFDFLTPSDISTTSSLIEVSYTGFGFLSIKKGVFENIQYPWFGPKYTTIGNCHDFASEDVSFCMRARDAGYKIYVDPTVWVKHQKLTMY
jgi:hypothetical protein